MTVQQVLTAWRQNKISYRQALQRLGPIVGTERAADVLADFERVRRAVDADAENTPREELEAAAHILDRSLNS